MASAPKLVHGRPGQFNQAIPTWGSGALSQDGKLYLISISNQTIRLGADGQLDTTYGPSGYAANHIIFGTNLVFDSSGKLWMLGTSTSPLPGGGMALVVERVTADGVADPGFNGGQPLLIDPTQSDEAVELLAQAGGKMMVAGATTDATGVPTPLLVRVNGDGTVDGTFGQAYRASLSNLYTKDVAAQPDGAIVLATAEMVTQAHLDASSFCIVRVSADGTVDTGFGNAGKFILTLPGYSYCSAHAVEVLADGKIIVAGLARPDSYNNISFKAGSVVNPDELVVIRLNSDGTLDSSFGNQGIAKAQVNAWPDNHSWGAGGISWANGTEIVVRPDGRIIVGTTTGLKTTGNQTGFDDESRAFAVQFSANGQRDMDFGTAGAATSEVNALPITTLRQVALTPSGGIVLVTSQLEGGTVSRNQSTQFYFDSNGRPDHSNQSGLPTTHAVDTFRAAPATELDAYLSIDDADGGFGGSHAGAALTLQRAGGASANDMLVATGALRFVAGQALVDGVSIGTVTQAPGSLRIDFNSNATTPRVNQALAAIGYTNQAAADQG